MKRKSNKKKAQLKDEEIKKYLPLVESVARKYKNYGIPLDDLINEGIFGIYKAKKNFDSKHGIKFSSYAIWWIRQCILSALSEQKLVHFPVGKINLNRKIKDIQEQYNRAFSRDASDEEIQQELDLDPEEYNRTMEISSPTISINQEIEADNPTTVEFFLHAETEDIDQKIDDEFIKEYINDRLQVLTERERFVIESHFGLNGVIPLGLEDIGIKLDLTRERCRQIKNEAIKKLSKILDPSFFSL